MIVFGIDAWQCHCASIRCSTLPPNISKGILEPPMAAYPLGCSASGTVSTTGVGTESV
jgi:hypothetical protein